MKVLVTVRLSVCFGLRCCRYSPLPIQIVNLCLENLGEEAELDDDLYDKLLENLLKRTKDKSPSVRQQACLALHRLQVRKG